MAAPPHYGTLRPWRGRSTLPKPPGTRAFHVTPSTSPNVDWAPSLLVVGSAQSDNTPAHTAWAEANQSSGRSTKHPGLGSSPLSSRSPHVASTAHVSALAPDMDGHRPLLRADPAGLHTGKYQSSFVKESRDSRHFMVTEAGYGTPAISTRSAIPGAYTDADRNHTPTQPSMTAAAGNHRLSMLSANAARARAPNTTLSNSPSHTRSWRRFTTIVGNSGCPQTSAAAHC